MKKAACERWPFAFALSLMVVACSGGGSDGRDAESPAEDSAFNFHKPQVYLGAEVSSNVFAWQVALQVGDNSRCGGVAVSRYHVLTAAHCVDSIGKDNIETPLAKGANPKHHPVEIIRVLQGSDEWKPGVVSVASIVFHPKWRLPEHAAKVEFDAAIVTLNQPLATDGIAVGKSRLGEGTTKAWVSGWGGYKKDDNSGSSKLRAAKLNLLPNAACAKVVSHRYLTDSKICAGDPKSASCAGDSGGPLVVGALGSVQLVGIVNAGSSYCGTAIRIDGQPTLISFFTRSSEIANWVLTATGNAARLTGAKPAPPFELPKPNEI